MWLPSPHMGSAGITGWAAPRAGSPSFVRLYLGLVPPEHRPGRPWARGMDGALLWTRGGPALYVCGRGICRMVCTVSRPPSHPCSLSALLPRQNALSDIATSRCSALSPDAPLLIDSLRVHSASLVYLLRPKRLPPHLAVRAGCCCRYGSRTPVCRGCLMMRA